MSIELYGIADLRELPTPEWMIENVIPEKGFVVLWGEPESYKSFLAIDLSLSVAAGIPWQGYDVVAGPVLYISAEGGRGIAQRAIAWVDHHDLRDIDVDALFVLNPILLHDQESDFNELVSDIEDMRFEDEDGLDGDWNPSLIVIDTLARCFNGDENLQEDMGLFIRAADRLRETFGCAVIIVHHARLGAERERGSTALRGAADTMLKVERNGTDLTISCDKQKDAEHFEDIELSFLPITESNSGVLMSPQTLKETRDSRLLGILEGGPASYSDLLTATAIPETSFKRLIKWSLENHKISRDSDGLYVLGSGRPKGLAVD